MVSTTIAFEKDNVQPPVFVAGAFTGWQPIEMTCKATKTNGLAKNVFAYQAELEPGVYQYKFRLGSGDWWVLDESSPTAADGHGNINNVLAVEAWKSESAPQTSTKPISAPLAHSFGTNGAYTVDESNINGLVDHKKIAQQPPLIPEIVSKAEALQTASVAPARNDTIPDDAPPPYLASANATATDPGEKVQVAPLSKALPRTGPEPPEAVGAPSRGKHKSFIAGVCSGRKLIMVVTMVALPIALSYYWRR